MRNVPRDTESGFTLGETMIAAVLTLIVISGAIETLTRTSTLTGTARVISETNHGLQAAMSLVVRDTMQTGQGIPLGGIPIPTDGGASALVRPSPGDAQHFDPGTLPAIVPGNGLGPTLQGVATDIVTMIYADETLPLGSNFLDAIAADGTSMTVNAATPVTGTGGIQAGDLILFTNSHGSALQMVTATPTSQVVEFADGDAMGLNQRGANSGTVLKLADSPGVYPPTTATRVLMISYYIDVTTDPSLPRLVRRVNMGSNLVIAMGVENVQATYDLVDGATNPTNVDTPPAGNSPNQIRKANLYLAARSEDVDPQTLQFFRNSIATQVDLRSLSFINRYF